MIGDIKIRNIPTGYPQVNLNNGAIPIYSQKFNDAYRQIIQAADAHNVAPGNGANQIAGEEYFTARNLPDILKQVEDQKRKDGGLSTSKLIDMAKFLQGVGQATVGRGINKQQQTPSAQDGLMTRQPALFGVQPKEPIPYAKLITDQHSMKAMLNGFQESMKDAGQIQGINNETPALIAQVQKKARVINDAFNVNKKTSIYSDPPRDSSVNLYNINVRNDRRDNLFAII